MNQIPVCWIPAHLSYGATSMLRCWQMMANECRADDRYRCESVLEIPKASFTSRGNVLQRQFARHLGYPVKAKLAAKSYPISHILDHSWADMLPYLPKNRKKVVTVHDLIPLRFPGELTENQANRFHRWVSNLKDADAIISVSEYTKNEVVDLLGIPAEKIHVVANGVIFPPDNIIPTRVSEKLEAIGDAFLVGSLGNTLERKNLEVFPGALERLIALTDRKVVLVRAGEMLPANLKSRLQSVLGTDGLVELGPIGEIEFEDFFQQIDVFCMPSLYEGFGLPVLESMARGVPVVAANSSSLPEVGGGAALFFDASKFDDCACQLVKIANDQSVASEFVMAGKSRAREFSWRRTLEQCYAVYDQLLE